VGLAHAPGPAGAPAVCPEVTTADNIELGSYTGDWYEVSVSAQFKLRNEAGLKCDKARYTLGAPGPSGAVVQVQNSGLYVTSPPFVGAINDVASGNRNSCRSVIPYRTSCLSMPSNRVVCLQPHRSVAAVPLLCLGCTVSLK